MSREKQIEEMAKALRRYECFGNCQICAKCWAYPMAEMLYNEGYRKQSEGEWKDNHCTACGMSPIGDEAWTDIGLTPPKFEHCMSFCPCCGAKMKGGTE